VERNPPNCTSVSRHWGGREGEREGGKKGGREREREGVTEGGCKPRRVVRGR